MLHSIHSLMELDTRLARYAGASAMDLDQHLLFVVDAQKGEGLAEHVSESLAQLELLPASHQSCHYHHYDMVPGLPGEGLFRFNTWLRDAGFASAGLPALLALDISSCALGPQSREVYTLLSFVRDCQLSTFFLFIIDMQVEQQIPLSRQLQAAVPIEGYWMEDWNMAV